MQATLNRSKARGDEDGFTLIELLIVIVILAILAAIVIFAVQDLTGSSAKASCSSDVSTVDHAAQAYTAQMGSAPTSIAQLMPAAPVPGVNGDLVGPWLHNQPVNGQHYAVIVGAGGAVSVLTTPKSTGSFTDSTGGKWAVSTPYTPQTGGTISQACVQVTS